MGVEENTERGLGAPSFSASLSDPSPDPSLGLHPPAPGPSHPGGQGHQGSSQIELSESQVMPHHAGKQLSFIFLVQFSSVCSTL